MVDNVQKLFLGASLAQKVEKTILNQVQRFSGRLPATLVKAKDGDKTQTVWMVNFETDGTYTLPQVEMPVHGNEFARFPYKKGDKGFVGTADVDTTSMSNLNLQSRAANFARPSNLAALVWHPIGNTTFKPVIDPKAHETYGRDSGTITHDGSQKSVVRTHKDDGTVISSGASGGATSASQADGPHKMTAHPTEGTKIETPQAHTLQANNATLDKQGNQTNEGNSTTKQNITSTIGNISAAAGSVMAAVSMSAPMGAFGGGSLGGLGFGSGNFGGIGTSGALGLIGGILNALNGSGGAGTAAAGKILASALDPQAAADVGLSNVIRAGALPQYASNAAALAGGLQPGQLYIYNMSGNHLLAVVF